MKHLLFTFTEFVMDVFDVGLVLAVFFVPVFVVVIALLLTVQ